MEQKSTKEEKFESIYRVYEKEVYRACLHISYNEDLAQEMTQQAFVNFYERMDRVKEECAKAYLVRSARNLMYNYFRDTKREMGIEEDDDDKEENPPQIDLAMDSVEDQYFEELQKSMKTDLTNEILAQLKEHHETWYEIIYKLFFLEMSHDEIADGLNVTKEVLYSRLHRAKLWIQKNYKENFDKIDTA